MRPSITRKRPCDDRRLGKLFFLASSGICFYARSKGVGLHGACLSHQDMVKALRVSIVYSPVIFMSVTFVRISVALIIVRIFAVSQHVKVWLSVCTFRMAFIMITCAVASVFQCHPDKSGMCHQWEWYSVFDVMLGGMILTTAAANHRADVHKLSLR